MSRCLVLGGAGLVGRHLVPELRKHGHDVYAPSRSMTDIEDIRQCRHALDEAGGPNTGPDYVFLLAAQTNVDYCEAEPEKTARTNVHAVANVVHAMREANNLPVLVYFSTDYIFPDGGPWPTGAVTGPLQVYGRQKLSAEHFILTHYMPTAVIVRTSWVWDKDKGFVANLRYFAENRQKMRIAIDQTGTPTYAPHLARELVKLLFATSTPRFIHLAGPKTSRTAWAHDAKIMLGLDIEFDRVRHRDLGYVAPRPVHGGSISTVHLPDHLEALREMKESL